MDKSLAAFRASIRAVVRGVYSGKLDALNGADALFSAIHRGFTQAWYEGAKQVGILPDELSKEELAKLDQMIGDNNQYVGNFIIWIVELSAKSGNVESAFMRADMWVNRYEEIKNMALAMAGENRKLRWILGAAEHCRSCLKLNGRVARAKSWAERNIHPRMTGDKLKCGGYRCQCSFMETEERITRGRWPNLP